MSPSRFVSRWSAVIAGLVLVVGCGNSDDPAASPPTSIGKEVSSSTIAVTTISSTTTLSTTTSSTTTSSTTTVASSTTVPADDNLLVTLSGHSDQVRGVDFSPDGAGVVTASYDGTAKVWDVDTGTLRLTLSDHAAAMHTATFSADGARIVTSFSDGWAQVWDAITGTLLCTLPGTAGYEGPASAGFSPDGAKVVTAAGDERVRVWDSSTGALLWKHSAGPGRIQSALFSPDGRRILTIGDHDTSAVLWDARSGEVVETLSASPASAAAFSRDGSTIVVGDYGGALTTFEAETGTVLLAEHDVIEPGLSPKPVTEVSFSAAGDWILNVIAGAGVAYVAAADTLALQWIDHIQDGGIFWSTAEFGPDDSRIIAGGRSPYGNAMLFDLLRPNAPGVGLVGHALGVNDVEFSPDGTKVITASSDNTAKIWRVPSNYS